MKKKLTTTENPLFHPRKISEAMKVSSWRRNIILIQPYQNLSFFVLSPAINEANYRVSPEQGVAGRSSRISALRYSLLSGC